MVKFKKYEGIFWFLSPILLMGSFAIVYGFSDMFMTQSLPLELVFGFSPLLFATLFKFIYATFPISHVLDLVTSKK